MQTIHNNSDITHANFIYFLIKLTLSIEFYFIKIASVKFLKKANFLKNMPVNPISACFFLFQLYYY